MSCLPSFLHLSYLLSTRRKSQYSSRYLKPLSFRIKRASGVARSLLFYIYSFSTHPFQMPRQDHATRPTHNNTNTMLVFYFLCCTVIQSALALSIKTSATTTSTTTIGPFSSLVSFAAEAGDNALSRVQWLGSRVAEKENTFEQSRNKRNINDMNNKYIPVDGIGGSVINNHDGSCWNIKSPWRYKIRNCQKRCNPRTIDLEQ